MTKGTVGIYCGTPSLGCGLLYVLNGSYPLVSKMRYCSRCVLNDDEIRLVIVHLAVVQIGNREAQAGILYECADR